MKRVVKFLVITSALLMVGAKVRAQDLLVPAGTLLHCTLDEPNLSSKTTSIGDPVVCRVRTFQEFGRMALPYGSMLGGHLEKAKDPGHFVGKGYLKLTFDRVILPYGDLPVPAKLIAAHGFKVDKKGEIKGKGHAKRDVVEWMLPPLWPWKVLMLPARGPRPTLKGEVPMELRLMEDMVIPRTLAYGPSGDPNRPPFATPFGSDHFVGPGIPAPRASEFVPGNENTGSTAHARTTTLVLQNHEVYEVTKFQIDNNELSFRDVNGKEGKVDMKEIDWPKTSQANFRVQRDEQQAGSISRANTLTGESELH